jgi:dephospho-CoA kinase
MSNLSKTKKIAITGSIGSGKSTVTQYVKSQGYPVFSADEVVHDLYCSDRQLKSAIQKAFGDDMIKDKCVDLKKLREYLIKHPLSKEQLESMVHPKVLEAFYEFESSTNQPVLFAEIPLLFEVNWQDYFDEIWFVYADQSVIFSRIREKRNLDDQTIEKMMKWQMDPLKKSAMSSLILYNNSQIESLFEQVDHALTAFR